MAESYPLLDSFNAIRNATIEDHLRVTSAITHTESLHDVEEIETILKEIDDTYEESIEGLIAYAQDGLHTDSEVQTVEEFVLSGIGADAILEWHKLRKEVNGGK